MFTSSAGRLAVQQRVEIDDRHVRRRHAHRKPVEPSLQLGQHLSNSGRRAGRRRDDRERRSPRPPEVLVRQVQQVLVVRVRVHCRHPPFAQSEAFVNDLGDRRQAVRRARGVRDDVVLGGIVHLLVHPEDDGDVRSLGGGGDDHLLRAGRQVLRGVFTLGEKARRFEDDVHPEVLPGELGGILERQHLELLAVDADPLGGRLDVRLEIAEHRVVLEEMGECG